MTTQAKLGPVRALEGQFPNATHADYEDAVSTGFEQLIRKSDRRMDNPRGYVATVAVNAMKRMLRRAVVPSGKWSWTIWSSSASRGDRAQIRPRPGGVFA